MPLYDYPCDCGEVTTKLCPYPAPETIPCPICGQEVRKVFPIPAQNRPMDHMGKFATRKEYDKHLDERGLVSSFEVQKQLDEVDPNRPVQEAKETDQFYKKYREVASHIGASQEAWDKAEPPTHIQKQLDSIHKDVTANLEATQNVNH